MKKALEVINELKQNGLIKEYAIGGAIAVLKWVEPFFTYGLDIFIILPEKVEKLVVMTPIYEYLKNKGYVCEHQWIVIEGITTDFIVADELEEEAILNATEIEIEGVKTKVIIPEYLIALFLRAGRAKDIWKIGMILEQTTVNEKKLNDILTKYNLNKKFKKFKRNQYGQ